MENKRQHLLSPAASEQHLHACDSASVSTDLPSLGELLSTMGTQWVELVPDAKLRSG